MSPILGIYASSHSPIQYANNFTSIATANPSGTNTVTFSSIPSTYTHLQIRCNILFDTDGYSCWIRFNSDSGNNYAGHAIHARGATNVYSAYVTSNNAAPTIDYFGVGGYVSYPTPAVVDILDYGNTNKYKTMRTLYGADSNGGGSIALSSSLWMNTNAISSITLLTNSSVNFTSGTSFALYGIK